MDLWQRCSDSLKDELPSQQYNTWIRPLQVSLVNDDLVLFAPNRFIANWVRDHYLQRIQDLVTDYSAGQHYSIRLEISAASRPNPQFISASAPVEQKANLTVVGDSYAMPQQQAVTQNYGASEAHPPMQQTAGFAPQANQYNPTAAPEQVSFTQHYAVEDEIHHESYVIPEYTFDTFVVGKSNQLARAAAIQVAENPGGSYNPLFLYGSVGLGKTHLMHAVGNELLRKNPKAKVLYIHSDKFVADMVKAYQLKAIEDFKAYYQGLDALLVDDIQFFAGKEGTQELFFSAFNALIHAGQQIILTSDKLPKEIKGLDERLKSRFSWGLSVAVEPPELETRVVILMKKAEQSGAYLSRDCAFFIAQRIRSNVRELEGALKRVIATAEFKGKTIDIDIIKESLKDLFSMQDRLVSIDNIQKTVAEYYKIRVADLLSKRRTRSVTRPRQVAMAIAKELTNHSLPEIGDAFGGRDHTTVLHACKKVVELRETHQDIDEDVKNLLRILTS